MRSLRTQLSVGLVLTLSTVAIVTLLVTWWLFERGLRNYAADQLENEVSTLLGAVARGPEGLILLPERIAPAYRRPLSGRYFLIETGQERWRSRSLWDFELALPPAPGSAPDLLAGPDGQQLLVLRRSLERYGHNLEFVVAMEIGAIAADLRFALLLLGGLWLAAMASLLLLQRLWISRALAPLDSLRDQVAALRRGEQSHLPATRYRELEPLVAETNRLLDSVRTRLQRSRHAVGNLGHALKLPLAVMQQLSGRAVPDLREPWQQQLTVIQRRLARELARGRLAGDSTAGTLFEPAVELPLLKMAITRAHQRPLEIAIDTAPDLPTRLPFERDDMLELLGNLLDNAAKWAASRIDVALRLAGDELLLTIADDGPGVPDDRLTELTERGSRLDESVSGDGLGLAIARELVAAYRGTLALTAHAAPLGGLGIIIKLPLPA